MKQGIYFLTFILLVFLRCTSGNEQPGAEKMNQNSSEANFGDFLKTLDKVPLPLSHNPFGKLPTLSRSYDKIAYEKYKLSWTSQPLGILFNDDKTVTIIDCSIGDVGLVPFLVSYDKQGNKIDSLSLYEKSGDDMGYHAIEYVTVNKDRSILVSDSVITYDLKPDSSDIDEATRKLTTGLIKYTIESNGRFKRVN